MARRHDLIVALNAGGVDKEALARIDLEKMRLAGEHPVSNWLPRILGPMTIRPGLESLRSLTAVTRPVPFIRDLSTTALLGFSDQTVTVFDVNGVPVGVSAVGSLVVNQSFVFAGGGWTDVSDTGAGTDGVVTLGGGGTAQFLATRWRQAATEQSVAIALADRPIQHTLRVEVARGPVFLRVGTASGGEELVTDTELITGVHKISFTPNAATIYIRLRSEDTVARFISLCQFENVLAGGAVNLTLPTPWLESDLPYLAWDQSADVMFIGDGRNQQRRIERRGTASWSITTYQTRNGPFNPPGTDKIALTPSAYSGNGTLTANRPYFRASHVGTLFELTHPEQHVIDQLHAPEQTTDSIRVSGLFSSTIPYDDRNFGYTLDFATGSFVGTVTLESSTDPEGLIWSKTKDFAAGASATYNDEQSNLNMRYRFRVTAYTSGYCGVTLTYLAGTTVGQVRVVEYTSSTSVNYETVKPLGGVTTTRDWRGPRWSSELGWPRVPKFRDDRLHWFRGDRDFASLVDDYDNYDDTVEGDSGPIDRTVGNGPAEGVRWAINSDRLVVGTAGYTAIVQASELNEVITPTSYAVRIGPTVGASFVPPVQVDAAILMADRSNTRLIELIAADAARLQSTDLTRLNPRAMRSGIKAMAVQRRPDTRDYVVLADGTCSVLTYDRDEKVAAITTIETDGDIVDLAVLPDTTQDDVYFIVSRNGGLYLERLAEEAAQESASTCTLLDGYKVLTGAVTAITGASHLNGKTVAVYADGVRLGTVVISGGGAALSGGPYARVVYGLDYVARFKSVKLSGQAPAGTAMGQLKIARHVGLVLSNSTLDGITVGPAETLLEALPDIVNGAERVPGQFVDHYEMEPYPVPSDFETDPRIIIEATASYGPKTVQSIVVDLEIRDGASPGN